MRPNGSWPRARVETGFEMSFLRLDLWWIAPLAVVAVMLGRWLAPRRAVAFTHLKLLDRSRYRASRLRYLPTAVIWLSLAVVLLALMRPSTPFTERQVEAKGLDIVFVIDLSLSMSGPIGVTGEISGPFVPAPPGSSRMDATKDALGTFIRLRRDDRIGIVVFSTNAYVVCPLTFDRDHLLNYFNLLDPNTLRGEGLTAIGDAITAATSLLVRQSAPKVLNKVIIAFTDGANNAGRDPVEAIKEATLAGIRVHVVGIDLAAEATRSPQVAGLINTVRGYGGRYFAANSKFDLTSASRVLDELEKGYLTTKMFERNEPMVHWFAVAALVLLAAALALRVVPVFVALH
jgi:Ca-activated chloride channel homolog